MCLACSLSLGFVTKPAMQWSGDAVQNKQQALCVLTLLSTLCLPLSHRYGLMYVLHRQYMSSSSVHHSNPFFFFSQQAASPSSSNSQPEICYPPLDNSETLAAISGICTTLLQRPSEYSFNSSDAALLISCQNFGLNRCEPVQPVFPVPSMMSWHSG